jgi:hypothetical protein
MVHNGLMGARTTRRIATGAALVLTAAMAQAGLGVASASAAAVPCSSGSLINAVAAVATTGGTVDLMPGCHYTLTSADNVVDGASGLPVIQKGVTVNGDGASIDRSSTAAFRFFDVASGASLALNNLTLSNGLAPTAVSPDVGYGGGAVISHGALSVNRVTFIGNQSPSHTGTSGGAIDSASALSVTNSTFTHNLAQEGGGIFAQGPTTISGSTFDTNTATDFGGGGLVSAVDTTTVTGSTFVGNLALDSGGHSVGGGAIDNDATVVVSNSTFTGNQGGSNGGGAIQNFGTARITASTLSGDSSLYGAEIHTFGATATTTVSRSIVADGHQGANCSPAVVDGGYNIDTAASCGFSNANQSRGATPSGLGPLAAHGGPTATMAIAKSSAALNAIPIGSACTPGADQRGVARPQGTGCDIGAFELVLTQTTETVVLAGGTITVSGRVTDAAGHPQSRMAVALSVRAYNAAFRPLATVWTNSSGTYSYRHAAATTLSYYRAAASDDALRAGSVSPQVGIKAPTTLRLAGRSGRPDLLTATLRFAGTGQPAAKMKIDIYFKRTGAIRWTLQGSMLTNSAGQARIAEQPRRGTYFTARFQTTTTTLGSATGTVYFAY